MSKRLGATHASQPTPTERVDGQTVLFNINTGVAMACHSDQSVNGTPQALASMAGSLCDAAFDPSTARYHGDVCCTGETLLQVEAGLRSSGATTTAEVRHCHTAKPCTALAIDSRADTRRCRSASPSFSA